MNRIAHIETIHEYNGIVSKDTLHPLVSLIDFAGTKSQRSQKVEAISFGFYAVFLKNDQHCEIKYGRNYYDYQQGSLVFIAPGQVVSIVEDGEDYQPTGHALLFHPDLIRGTSLSQHIKEYSFFSYDVHEALHLSEEERQIVKACFKKIAYELKRPIDKHSKKLIVANIQLFLDYCIRFYDRQFITRSNVNAGVLERFEHILNNYFASDKPQNLGLPTVGFCAEQLHLSANYLGDLIKKETGKSAQEHILLKVIESAKTLLYDGRKSVSQVAYELGYKYPQHFTRLFKQKVGASPHQYRKMN